MKLIEKYTFGLGDRFGHQGVAQLKAIMKANDMGVSICPVWNKSNREHSYIGTKPTDTRVEADNAVKATGWKNSYYVDADHINMSNVDSFIDCSDFFTIDVAAYIGKPAEPAQVTKFLDANKKFIGKLSIPGIAQPFDVTEDLLNNIAKTFLNATIMAGEIYRRIESKKGVGTFVTEVSMDEVAAPQTPVELFFILKMLSEAKVPAQTIAPKFTGRFNKGVDYIGDIVQFEKEFEEDLLVIDYVTKEFDLPKTLKLSVHSGSDKFSIYPIMGRLIKKHNKGIHVKTAGTTWLEELIGLALAGGQGLELAKEIYRNGLERMDEMTAPYADVIDIDSSKLPSMETVEKWTGEQYANAMRHNQACSEYNMHMRQLVHVAYKIAADKGAHYYNMLEKFSDTIGQCVTENIFDRHIKIMFF